MNRAITRTVSEQVLVSYSRSSPLSVACSRGSVAIEFILICPILLALIGYSLRLTQLLQGHQIAMAISREAATEGFRQCIDISLQNRFCATPSQICLDTSSMQTATSNCLARLKDKYSALWSSLQPSGTVSLSFNIDLEVYRYDMSSATPTANCSSADANSVYRISTNSEIPSLFSTDDGRICLCQRNRVARARVAFKLAPAAAFLQLIQGYVDQDYDIIDDTLV